MRQKSVKIISGDSSFDDRGVVKFINDFNFKNVKRFYQVTNHNTKIIRAFHAHKKEQKYVYVAKGTILLCLAPIVNFSSPSKKTKVRRIILSDKKPQIVYVPEGYANGFRSLEKDSVVIFYSTSTLIQSQKDDYRYPHDYWGKSIWKTKNR